MALAAKKPTKGLGKGLSALMSDAEPTISATAPERPTTSLPLEVIVAGSYQPRRQFEEEALHELADSIEKNGVVQPLIVRKIAAGKYEIIAGERRFRAAKLAKLNEVPVVVRDYADNEALAIALIENIQRENLNPLEEAQAFERLMQEFAYTQEAMAQSVGKSRSHIANMLRLLGLPEEVKAMIDAGTLSMGHARAILGAGDPLAIAKAVITQGLSVRQTEALVRGDAPTTAKKQINSATERPSKNNDIQQLEAMLSQNLGLRVAINTKNAQAGEVVIGYDSLAQLDEILKRLGGSI